MNDYDIIIVGGGMVGATLACALGDSTLRIAVLEGNVPARSWDGAGFDVRVSAITRASQRIFQSIGAWQGMVATRVTPYRDMHVWDATGDGVIHFDSAEVGEPDLGHIIENRVITKALVERVEQFANIQYLCPALPQALRVYADHAELQLDDGRCLRATLVVGADGANSFVREQAGIAIDVEPYGQTAVVATLATELPHRDTAWQRFLPSGPLAFLPLAHNHSSIVWSTTPEAADDLIAQSDSEFARSVEAAFANTLGKVTVVGARAAFPLSARHARHYVQGRIALIGDAAHTIHPLAGQGVNLGLADAAVLAEVICDARRDGRDVGALSTLRRYERWRKSDNLLMLQSMGALKRLFSNDTPAFSALRNLGLNVTQRLAPIKNLFIRHAMGLVGDLPKRAR